MNISNRNLGGWISWKPIKGDQSRASSHVLPAQVRGCHLEVVVRSHHLDPFPIPIRATSTCLTSLREKPSLPPAENMNNEWISAKHRIYRPKI